MKQISRAAILFTFLIIINSTLGNASPLTLTYSIGFGGVFQSNHWTPITITLKNEGRGFTGNLEINVSTGSIYDESVQTDRYSTTVELNPRSTKSYRFIVYIDSFVHPLTITVSQNNKPISSSAINLRDHLTEKPLIPVFGREIDAMFMDGFPEEVSPVFSRVIHLPESWMGYDAVSAVLIPVSELNQLSTVQMEALKQWISSGGQLIVNSSLNYGAFQSAKVRQLLPIKISGYKTHTAMPQLEAYGESPLSITEPVLTLDLTGDHPLGFQTESMSSGLYRQRIGSGSVIVFPFDYQLLFFKQWPGRPVFWQKLLNTNERKSGSTDIPYQAITTALIQGINVHFPELDRFILICVAYVVLFGLILLIYNRNHDKIRKIILSMFGLWVGFSIVGGALFITVSKRDKLITTRFIHHYSHNDAPVSIAKEVTGLVSFQNHHYTQAFSEKNSVTRLLKNHSQRHKSGKPAAVIQRQGDNLFSLDARHWGRYVFQSTTITPNQLRVQVEAGMGGLELTVRNHHPHPVTAIEVFYDDSHWPIGRLLPGEHQTITLSNGGSVEKTKELFGVRLPDLPEVKQERNLVRLLQTTLIDSLLTRPNNLSRDKTGKTIRVFGWIDYQSGDNVLVHSAKYHQISLVELTLNESSEN